MELRVGPKQNMGKVVRVYPLLLISCSTMRKILTLRNLMENIGGQPPVLAILMENIEREILTNYY